ncbi:MAG: type VI secretion system tip protein VgrG [Mongoliibacter sp.]|uniref:type VI secretion system tip protein VgrG n=1 Tax=Mongoliibacter sp. TaxID=2022438 RepID=UPI0012F132A2|nr:type VI secretion system tip protein VgrG [Mongoliibacter sp.]TVP46482.1 MAG: type VI secretion system tip protein VgrG [Mongoliibacter sp.]
MSENLKINDLPVSFEVSINGKVLSGAIEIISLSVSLEVNRIASANLKVSDGGAFGLENEPFSNSASSDFIPGNEIVISLGYGDDRKTVFKGVILAQRMIVRNNTSFLQVSCKDKSFKLTKSRSNTVMADSKDDDLIKKLVSNAGLTAEVESATKFAYPLFQYNTSDWDYIVIRAEANNFFVITDENKVKIKAFDLTASPKFSIQADVSALEVDLEINGENTYSEFNFTSWDPKSQKTTVVKASMADPSKFGNLTAQKIAKDLAVPSLNKFTSAPLSSSELTAFSKSWISKSALTKIQGKILIPGTAQLKPGDLVGLKSFGERFEGNAFISKIEHEYAEGDWKTSVFVGLHSRWHSSLSDVEEVGALGLLPGIKGCQIAKVKKINEDPDGDYRVLIQLEAFQNKSNSNELWARIAFNYASHQAGFFFFPEIGDEVLVSFINGDPRFPVITGSVYSSKQNPKFKTDAENTTKAIHTKSGLAIIFNDKDKIFTIKTPGGNTVILDDKKKQLSMQDMNSNEAILSKDGIKFSSPKDITLDAKGKISLKAVSGIELTASGGDLKGKGLNVALEAQVAMKAAGNASAEFSAAGQTVVKGAMVMIN